MNIYRFVPQIEGYAHPWRSGEAGGGRTGSSSAPSWRGLHDMSSLGILGHIDGRYRRSPEELAPSDFPLLSLQLPVVSEHAAKRARLPSRARGRLGWPVQPAATDLDRREAVLRGAAAAQPPRRARRLRSRGLHRHSHAARRGHSLSHADVRAGPGARRIFHHPGPRTVRRDLRDRSFRRPRPRRRPHRPRGPRARLRRTPIPPHRQPPPAEALDPSPGYRQQLEWELFIGRGSVWHYLDRELEEAFRSAVLDGLLPIS